MRLDDEVPRLSHEINSGPLHAAEIVLEGMFTSQPNDEGRFRMLMLPGGLIVEQIRNVLAR